jgi:hypothetical protein
MIIAQEKRQQNIIEYLLYMFQVEDTIRACQFNIETIEEHVISQFKVGPEKKEEIRNWYSDIIVMMHQENVKDKGHISIIQSLIGELNGLHHKLINEQKDPKYLEQYSWAYQNIKMIEKKLGRDPHNEIDTCLNGMYALLIMRLQKRKVSEETLQALQTFSNMLALLAKWFKKVEEGEAEI